MSEYTKFESQDWAKENLRGQWSTLVTPFKEDFSLDQEGLISNINHIRTLGTQGLGCTWGMGEFWSLSFEERLRIYDIVSDAAKGMLIGAHVSHTSLTEIRKLTDYAQYCGFDIIMVAAPYFVTKTEDQVVEFVKEVAKSTSMGIMYYNSPQFGVVLGVEKLQEICQIPNVVGVKEASFNQNLSISAHQILGDDHVISTPDEWIFFKGKELGFNQQVMFANTSDWRFDRPGKPNYVNFVNRAVLGDLDEKYYNSHIKEIKAISDKWWQYTVKKFNGVLPVAMCKYWGELMGMTSGGVRLPLFDLTKEEKIELKEDLSILIE